MDRRLTMLAIALLLGACGDDGADTADTDARDTTASDGLPAYALMRGPDTLLIEQYTLEGSRVSGAMRDPSGSSVEYETIHARDGGQSTMRITMRTPDPAAAPAIVSTFRVNADSAWLETTRGDSTIHTADTLGGGALPYMSPSMGMLALVAQSARALVGDSGQVELLAASVSQPPVVVQPLVYWRADTAYIIGDEMNRFRLVFSDGELVEAEAPALRMRAVRIPGSAFTARGRPQAGVPADPQPGASPAPETGAQPQP